jgi:uncharacterized protein (TIGR00255 family)
VIRSMTGFSHREIEREGLRGSLELKSYNNRYLDLSVYLPPYLSRLEPRFRSFLSERVVHGKVEASLRVRELDAPASASADLAAASAVAGVLRQIAEACGIDEPVRLSSVVGVEGVVAFERRLDEDALWARLLPELEACFADYDESRLGEGAATAVDIRSQLARVSAAVALIRSKAPEIESTIRSQLSSRFKEVLGDAVDEGRVLAEVASYLMKYTINEELSRLAAHIESFSRILESESAPGKKLDFLCQEMNREVNTVGSKSMMLEVSRAVVELKDALENVREQLRNVE